MKKSEIAANYDSLINNFIDYIEFGYKREHATIDFSAYDIIKKAPPVTEISQQIPKQQAPLNKALSAKQSAMLELGQSILKCTNCLLASTAIQKIPGSGNIGASIMVISYPVSLEEEKAGIPFVGNSGDFFSAWLSAINLDRSKIFVTNLVKCCPKRTSLKKELIEECLKHLDRQIAIIQPKILLVLGQLTVSALNKKFTDLATNHGEIHTYQGLPFIATWHPFDVLVKPILKKAVWEDLKFFKNQLIELNIDV